MVLTMVLSPWFLSCLGTFYLCCMLKLIDELQIADPSWLLARLMGTAGMWMGS